MSKFLLKANLAPIFQILSKVSSFHPLHADAYTGTHTVVAVPSRLYFPTSSEKPPKEKRVTVKDNFHLAGLVTTMGSRSHDDCYGVQEKTSIHIREIVSKRAIIIGKTKMGASTGSEAPPKKSIDCFPPWDPRGDGHQGPSVSSTGAGSSVAG